MTLLSAISTDDNSYILQGELEDYVSTIYNRDFNRGNFSLVFPITENINFSGLELTIKLKTPDYLPFNLSFSVFAGLPEISYQKNSSTGSNYYGRIVPISHDLNKRLIGYGTKYVDYSSSKQSLSIPTRVLKEFSFANEIKNSQYSDGINLDGKSISPEKTTNNFNSLKYFSEKHNNIICDKLFFTFFGIPKDTKIYYISLKQLIIPNTYLDLMIQGNVIHSEREEVLSDHSSTESY